jgi:ribosomal protein L11 methyltransferase
MYTWRKRATAGWLRVRSEELSQQFGPALAIIERPGKVRALLEIACRTEREARQLVREFGGSVEKLRSDWLVHFAKQAISKPLRIGSRLVIRSKPDSTRKQTPPRARTIVIPAEAAFGTGQHATTAMCLRLLERTTRKWHDDWAMLDAGTGSGILAIAGSCLGAGRVLAIDNDPLACTIAMRNARANGARNIEFRTGDILKQKLSKKFDIIAANLFSEILIAVLPRWSRHLASGGSLILSGILRSQERDVAAALRANAFAVQETRRRGKWIALLAFRRTARKAVPTCKRP